MTDTRTMVSKVEISKAASRVCKKLFPEWTSTSQHGDLQRIIIALNGVPDADKKIKAAGEWWLWARNLSIENIFERKHKLAMINIAVCAARHGHLVHFVSARSPELLHAQIPGQGDKSLPRSRQAVETIARIAKQSSQFLPTTLTIVFADLAIDNLEEIQEACDVEATIEENIERVEDICRNSGLPNFSVARMSELDHPQGKLGELISKTGEITIAVRLSDKAHHLIATATRESQESHTRTFGWTQEQSAEHNKRLGITMGLVGQAVKGLQPSPILIHNEAFISRGALNNLFTDEADPLPVICLRTLLETKRPKV